MLLMDKLFNKDCCHNLSLVPDNSVHLTFTSPPYNADKDYDNYGDNLPWPAYKAFIMSVFSQIYDKMVSGGRLAINLPEVVATEDRCVFMPELFQEIMREIGFIPRDVINWIKQPDEETFCGSNTKWGSWRSPSSPCIRSFSEKIIVWSKDSHKLESNGEEPDITSWEFKTFTKNCWFVPTNSCKVHPAIFPPELAYRVIKLYSFPKMTVLDPFSGIGTTLIEAKKLGRRYVGYELSEKYCKLAWKQLSKNYNELTPTQQEALF